LEEWTAGKDFLRWGERKGEMKRQATRKDLKMDTLQGLRRKGVTDRWTAGKDFLKKDKIRGVGVNR
jgi:hypothetical protein